MASKKDREKKKNMDVNKSVKMMYGLRCEVMACERPVLIWNSIDDFRWPIQMQVAAMFQ